MSIYFNQTNVTPGSAFAGSGGGGGGGSNFPDGLSIGTIPYNMKQEPLAIWGQPGLVIEDNGGGTLPVVASQFFSYIQPGDATTQKSASLSPTYLRFQGNAGSGGSTDVIVPIDNALGLNGGTQPAFNIQNVSSIQGNMTNSTSNTIWYPIDFKYQPSAVAQGGNIGMRLTYDPLDAGQTAVEIGAGIGGKGNAYIGAVWQGYIAMPLSIWGATIEMYSDNETFFFMDGKAGGLGNVSTGVPFLSASNAFSSIKAPTGEQANMSALLSTLKSVYPACFN